MFSSFLESDRYVVGIRVGNPVGIRAVGIRVGALVSVLVPVYWCGCIDDLVCRRYWCLSLTVVLVLVGCCRCRRGLSLVVGIDVGIVTRAVGVLLVRDRWVSVLLLYCAGVGL